MRFSDFPVPVGHGEAFFAHHFDTTLQRTLVLIGPSAVGIKPETLIDAVDRHLGEQMFKTVDDVKRQLAGARHSSEAITVNFGEAVENAAVQAANELRSAEVRN